MNLIIKNNVNMMNISLWDKIFVMNYYNGNIPYDNEKEVHIQNDIKSELEKLYNIDKSEFKISINSPDLLRKFDIEIKNLESRGEYEKANYLKNDKIRVLNEMSELISNKLYEEYIHICNTIKNASYPNSFKYLLLNETLNKTYRFENGKIIVGKRKNSETIQEQMILNSIVIDYIFKNIKNSTNFSKLYFEAISEYSKVISQDDKISIDDIETYGKGKWIKFNGYNNDQEHYQENFQKLASLVQNTPWCTKTLAGEHLKQGNFYVFVDNNNQPHIAVKLNGNEIDEIRGIANDMAQEIEDDYRNVVLSFLKNNREIKYGIEWLEKEEANKRLETFINQINNGTFDYLQIGNLLNDLCKAEYKSHGLYRTSTKREILFSDEKFKKGIELYFGLSPDEICYGDCIIVESIFHWNKKKNTNYLLLENGNCSIPYKIILGNIYPDYKNIRNGINVDLQNLQRIYGNCILNNTQTLSLKNLKFVYGELDIGFCWNLHDLGNLEYIGGMATFEWTKFKDVGNLKIINGDCHAESARIESLVGVEIKGRLYTSSRNSYLSEEYYLQQNESNISKKI